jgi:predicted CopG family antitoxin
MATKTITITQNAYDSLKLLKQETESFSDIITKITKRSNLSQFAGLLKNEKRDFKKMKRENAALWEKRLKGFEK